MRTAVLRVGIDLAGELSAIQYQEGVADLRQRGLEVVASPAANLPDTHREIELLLDDLAHVGQDHYLKICSAAFGLPATAGVPTYVSRGTDEDVHGILSSFGLQGGVSRSEREGDELVTVVLDPELAHRVPESRLHTALEAALNCEVDVRWLPAGTTHTA